MPNDFVIARSNDNYFLCVTTSTLISTSAPGTLPDDAVCVRLSRKDALDGYCPPVGQPIPKENYFVFDSSNNELIFYQAISSDNCTVTYNTQSVPLGGSSAKFRYYSALILYGVGFQRSGVGDVQQVSEYDQSGNLIYRYNVRWPLIDQSIFPLRYEVWYFEFDSLEDARNLRNPKPKAFTPLPKSVLSNLRQNNVENFLRGVGFAREFDFSFLTQTSYYIPTSATYQGSGTKSAYFVKPQTGDISNLQYNILSPQQTAPKLYSTGLQVNAAVLSYLRSNRNFFKVPLWPLIPLDADINGIGDDQVNAVNSTKFVYINNISFIFPDRFYSSLAFDLRYPNHIFSVIPSLEKFSNSPTIVGSTSLKIGTFGIGRLKFSSPLKSGVIDKDYLYTAYNVNYELIPEDLDPLRQKITYNNQVIDIKNVRAMAKYNCRLPLAHNQYYFRPAQELGPVALVYGGFTDWISGFYIKTSNYNPQNNINTVPNITNYINLSLSSFTDIFVSNSASIFKSNSSWSSLVFNEDQQQKSWVTYPISIFFNPHYGSDIIYSSSSWNNSFSLTSFKIGVQIVYTVQYGNDSSPKILPYGRTELYCPPVNEIPYSQYIFNLPEDYVPQPGTQDPFEEFFISALPY